MILLFCLHQLCGNISNILCWVQEFEPDKYKLIKSYAEPHDLLKKVVNQYLLGEAALLSSHVSTKNENQIFVAALEWHTPLISGIDKNWFVDNADEVVDFLIQDNLKEISDYDPDSFDDETYVALLFSMRYHFDVKSSDDIVKTTKEEKNGLLYGFAPVTVFMLIGGVVLYLIITGSVFFVRMRMVESFGKLRARSFYEDIIGSLFYSILFY